MRWTALGKLRGLRRLMLIQIQIHGVEAIGVCQKAVNRIGNLVFTPSTLLALSLANALRVSVHDIFELEE